MVETLSGFYKLLAHGFAEYIQDNCNGGSRVRWADAVVGYLSETWTSEASASLTKPERKRYQVFLVWSCPLRVVAKASYTSPVCTRKEVCGIYTQVFDLVPNVKRENM